MCQEDGIWPCREAKGQPRLSRVPLVDLSLSSSPAPAAAVVFWQETLEQGRKVGGLLTASASSYFISVCLYIIIPSRWLPRSVVEGRNISGFRKSPGSWMEDKAIILLRLSRTPASLLQQPLAQTHLSSDIHGDTRRGSPRSPRMLLAATGSSPGAGTAWLSGVSAQCCSFCMLLFYSSATLLSADVLPGSMWHGCLVGGLSPFHDYCEFLP